MGTITKKLPKKRLPKKPDNDAVIIVNLNKGNVMSLMSKKIQVKMFNTYYYM